MTALPRKSAVNVRRPEIMEQVTRDIGSRYSGPLIDLMKKTGNVLETENMTIRLARQFGFCNGVKRAIETAHATRIMFPDRRIFLIGEIIHNPDVNRTLDEMGLQRLPWQQNAPAYDDLREGDVVLIPAFGLSIPFRQFLESKGVTLVDATCGDVMRVWRQVAKFSQKGITSVIHGKASHEETIATASHALGESRQGHFIIIYNQADVDCLANYILGMETKDAFLSHFKGAVSPGFDPDKHLRLIGMANQTTMLKDETRYFQQILHAAVLKRDGNDDAFSVCDTICNATQDRQSALTELLEEQPDAIFVVGGYNSSNTTHLVEIAQKSLPATFFVIGDECLIDLHRIRSFDIAAREEKSVALPPEAADLSRRWHIGITAGASCPSNKIEEVICRLAALRNCTIPSEIL